MEGISAPIKKGPGLYEFLVEAELQQYFNSFRNDLKITHPSQLKFTTETDLIELGMSKPEMRRLKKFYDKHFPNNYLSKIKKLIKTARNHDTTTHEFTHPLNSDNVPVSKAPRVPSKHIIPAANITVNKELGMGEFGVVQQGVWCNEGERIQVAIKCLARDRMQTNTIEFLKEAAIMHSIDHEHIVRLYGVVLDTVSLMLVTELAPLRSLLECLKEPSLRSSFPVLTLCDFAVQICHGMQYLEAKRLIHRDLAARNILVFSKNKVKISDFGLSRALGQGKDYYQTNFNVNLKLPIAWCAPECISYLRFTSASDVWAFAVTLWEMFSYGFQPWAALTGQQILEAIDEPNYQRLEQPDCCPLDHYQLMLDCWRHDASTRPRFADVATKLVDCRPEQVQAKVSSSDGPHLLPFRVGDVVTVLDKISHRPLWKGVTLSGKTGLFDPSNVVAYLGSDLPTSSFLRTDSTRTSARRKLKSEMISAPQGDLKHTGHVGLDGAYFGDLSFLGGAKSDYSGIPTQVVPPFRPHEDLEAAPLLDDHIALPPAPSSTIDHHEYHEISDDEAANSPPLDLGPSLLDEMQRVFGTLNHPPPPSPAEHESSNKNNELREILASSSSSKQPRKQATVKPISAHDQKTLETAIALAHEYSSRSMSAPMPTTPVSPNKRKFSFRFPSVTDHEKPVERRNFSEEAQSTPDLQSKVTQEAELAYQSLVENRSPTDLAPFMPVGNPLRMLRSGFPVVKPRTKMNTLPHAKSATDRRSATESLDGNKSDSNLELSRPQQQEIQSIPIETNSDTPDSPRPIELQKQDENPIPLPPRDRKKPLLTAKPRHTRKHPLIIPPLSLQGTLNKFTVPTPPATVSDPFQSPSPNNGRGDGNFDFDAQIESNISALDDIASDGQDCVDAPISPKSNNDLPEKIQSHHVSCEDLLEFADAKPSSRTRGNDSDQVRILIKVFRNDISTEQCLEALNHTDWEVLKAIKVIKLQKVVPGAPLGTYTLALDHCSWDITKAAHWILQQDGEVAQV
ncbi:activated Cdc42 kinase-like isoform X2 [Onthophagus taurus]|uniref:activated Cdc42 kinase-like isoform X2 n=1 Tax=Onthophagus taurus TaxID=166361 RepID=UPI000C1FE91B|nr:tyrosine-protein kinase PR2-like isoform X2 [Onthophagus taurus]